MEDLKYMLETKTISEINTLLSRFVHSVDGYGDKLKVSFVLLNLMQECSQVFGAIDKTDFISDISDRINKLVQEANSDDGVCRVLFSQNNEIVDVLTNSQPTYIRNLRNEIDGLLCKYDDMIKKIVEIRDSLPIEKQLVEEKK